MLSPAFILPGLSLKILLRKFLFLAPEVRYGYFEDGAAGDVNIGHRNRRIVVVVHHRLEQLAFLLWVFDNFCNAAAYDAFEDVGVVAVSGVIDELHVALHFKGDTSISFQTVELVSSFGAMKCQVKFITIFNNAEVHWYEIWITGRGIVESQVADMTFPDYVDDYHSICYFSVFA